MKKIRFKRWLALLMSIIMLMANSNFMATAKAATLNENILTNGGFDDGLTGWTIEKGSTASNNGHPGKHFYLDGATDLSAYIQQTVIVPYSGTYEMSVWIACAGAGAKFGIRWRDSKEVIKEIAIEKNTTYSQYSLDGLSFSKNDELEIYVTGSNGWINGDTFYLACVESSGEVEYVFSGNMLLNPDFDFGVSGWNVTKGGLASNNGHTGQHYFLQSKGYISQTIQVPYTGDYKVSTWVSLGGTGAKFGVKLTGSDTTIKEVDLADQSLYNQYELEVSLKKGDSIEVYISGSSGWTNGDSFSVTYNTTRFLNLLVNPDFTSDEAWECTNAELGDNIAKLSADDSNILQNVYIPVEGPYYLEVEVEDAENLQIQLDNKEKSNINGTDKIIIESGELTVGQEIAVSITGIGNIKSVILKFDKSKFKNDPPVASEVTLTGDATVNEILSASYTYDDPDGHFEGNSVYAWLISDTVDGEYAPIEGAVGNFLVLLPEYQDKFIKFQVTPLDQYEGEGESVCSNVMGPVDLNIVSNPSFERDQLYWSNIKSSNKNAYKGLCRAIIAVDVTAYQTITVPKTGYYNLSAYFNYPGDESGEMGIRDMQGNVLAKSDILSTTEYTLNKIDGISLEKGQQIQVYFKGASDVSYDADDIVLKIDREKATPPFKNIFDIETTGIMLNKSIDQVNKKISVKYIYGTDFTNITLKSLALSDGAKASVGAGSVMDLSKPFQITVTGSDNETQIWTVEASEGIKEIGLVSSNKYLQDTFNWAVNKQKQFVMTGKEGVINKYEGQTEGDGTGNHAYLPSYWAGYYDRSAFYGRDFVHQATGGQIAGLTAENFSMFEMFAKQCTESRKWYTLWAMNFDGSPLTIDYKSDTNFVHEVPAQFELVEKAYEQYLWSGDERYIMDDTMWNFYTKVMTDFITLHDDNGNGIAEGKGGIFAGSCTYNERGEHPVEAGDAIGSQYQAILAYAAMLEVRGELEASKEWYQKAEDLKTYFNEEWSVVEGESRYARILTKDGEKKTDFGKENSWFIPMKMISEPGERNNEYIDYILEKLGDGIGTAPEAPSNLEAYTYIPDMLFVYNRSNDAWKWMKYITSIKDEPHERPSQGTNGDYPEISFTFVSHTIEGMMGVEPDAGKGFVVTAPRLPDEVPDMTANYIPFGDYEVNLTHKGNTESIMTNHSEKDLTWEARFYGNYDTIKVGSEIMTPEVKDVNGETVSFVTVTVKAGETLKASAYETYVAVENITIEQSRVNMSVDSKVNLTAAIGPENASDKTVTWTSSNPELVDVNDNGTITALGAGVVTITAQAEGKKAECIVNVTYPNSKDKINELIKKLKGYKQSDYTADTWKVLQSAIVSATKVISNPNASQTEIDSAFNSLTKAMVGLKRVVKVAKVSLNKSSLSMIRGTKVTLKATVSPANAANKKLKWTSSKSSVASISQGGTITARKAGKTTIKAAAADGSGKYKTCTVTVYNKTKSLKVRAKGFSLNGNKLTLQKGKTTTLKASVATSGAMKGVTFKSSKKSVATVSPKGKIKALKTGKAKITITSKDKKYKKTYTVTVVKKSLSAKKIKAKVKKVTLTKKGSKYYLPAKLSVSVKGKSSTSITSRYTYKSLNKKVVKITSAGDITAVKKGETSILIKNGKASVKIKVVVKK